MNAANFAGEFTQLVMRYTSPRTPNNDVQNRDDSNTQLTVEQILELMQESLRAMFQLPAQDLSSYVNLNKTPANEIVIITPNAPTVQRTQHNHSNGIDSSMSFSKTQEEMDSVLESSQSSTTDMKDSDEHSRKRLSSIGRSDTFVCEEENNNIKKEEKSPCNDTIILLNDKDTISDIDNTLSAPFRQKLEALRRCAIEMVTKIDDMEKQSYQQSTKPIRRLSAVGTLPSITRSTAMMRSIPPPKIRRSFSAFQATPTSSRLNNTLTVDDSLSKKKSGSTTSLQTTGTNKLSTSPIATRSNTTLSLPATKKTSNSSGKPPKNPKYAHIQSSIPKAAPVVKKKST